MRPAQVVFRFKTRFRANDSQNMERPRLPRRALHLRLLGRQQEAPPEPELVREVRSVRKDMARLLRAMQASGLGVSTWPDEVLSRLAHVDAVTARYLIAPEGAPEAVREAKNAMRSLEGWVLTRMSARELAEVRAFELMIRVADEELDAPLLCPDGSPEEQAPAIGVAPSTLSPRSLRAGLRGLSDEELITVCRRLGLRPLPLEGHGVGSIASRERMESAVTSTLRDDHLLSILVATLSRNTHELLAALVRRTLGDDTIHALAHAAAIATTVGGDTVTITNPVGHLRACGLLFSSGTLTVPTIWVPVELQRRLDGTLRTFGL